MQVHTKSEANGIPPPATSKMAASQVESCSQNLGEFHPKCSKGVQLSENRRIATGFSLFTVAFSNEPIPNGLKFSVKILQKSSGGWVSPISAASIPHTLDAPYMAGGAVHVIHCCLLYTVMT